MEKDTYYHSIEPFPEGTNTGLSGTGASWQKIVPTEQSHPGIPSEKVTRIMEVDGHLSVLATLLGDKSLPTPENVSRWRETDPEKYEIAIDAYNKALNESLRENKALQAYFSAFDIDRIHTQNTPNSKLSTYKGKQEFALNQDELDQIRHGGRTELYFRPATPQDPKDILLVPNEAVHFPTAAQDD